MSEERATELEREVFEAITGWPLDEAPDGGVDEDTAAWLATARAAIAAVHASMTVEYAAQGGGITHPATTLANAERYAEMLRMENVEAVVFERYFTPWIAREADIAASTDDTTAAGTGEAK